MNNLHDEISKILIKWDMPTRQVAIGEIKNLLKNELASLIEDLEKKYGKYGEFTGSMGYQGIVYGIQSFQHESDKVRDKIIDIIRKRMEE